MKGLIKILISSLLMINFYGVLAFVGPTQVNLEKATSTSLNISWDTVSNSEGYFVYYSTNLDTLKDGVLESLVKEPFVTINNLEKNTTYFIAVSSINSDFNESDFSPTATFKTNIDNTTDQFLKLTSVDVIYSNQYDLVFNKLLSSDADGLPREIKIIDKSNEFADFEILNTNVTGNKLNIKVNPELEVNKEYEFIVVELYDENLNPVNTGVDASLIITTPSTFGLEFPSDELINLGDIIGTTDNTTTDTAIIDNTTTDNTTTTDTITNDTTTTITNDNGSFNSGTNGSSNNVELQAAGSESNNTLGTNAAGGSENNTFETATNIQKLPQTGPAEWLLLAISLLLGTLVFTINFKRKS